ncbi:MAG TPA: RidA family protein [Ktedonobacteraceae bacterium]|nr:RidA family protein [Ktedonobacteraceae bacterium]
MKIPRNPEQVHAPVAGYHHQIEVTGAQRWLVLSGQIGKHADGHLPEDPIEQLSTALENLRLNLKSAGMGVSDIVKLTIYLVGEIGPQQRREVLDTWLAGHRPTMTVLYVAALAAPIYRVEIDAWACQDESR